MSNINEALKKLHAALFRAEEFRRSNPQSGRLAALIAIYGIIEFIDSVDELNSQDLDVPLGLLATALADLEHGTISDILKPSPRRSGRRKDPSSACVVRGFAAATMEVLMKASDRENSAKSIAAILKREGIKLGGRAELTWRTVANWRDQIKTSHEVSQEKVMYEEGLKNFQELEHAGTLPTPDTPAKKVEFHRIILFTFKKTIEYLRD